MIVRRVWPTRPTFDGSLHHYDAFRRELLRTLDRPVEEFNRKQMGQLSEPQLKTLVKLLEAVRAE